DPGAGAALRRVRALSMSSCGGRSGVLLSARARLEKSPPGGPRSARRVSWHVTCVVLLATGWSGVARAIDLKVWPLFRYARDDERGLLHWSAFGPLVEFSNTPETRDFRIRPLLWLHQRRGAERDDRTEFLYPIVSSRW